MGLAEIGKFLTGALVVGIAALTIDWLLGLWRLSGSFTRIILVIGLLATLVLADTGWGIGRQKSGAPAEVRVGEGQADWVVLRGFNQYSSPLIQILTSENGWAGSETTVAGLDWTVGRFTEELAVPAVAKLLKEKPKIVYTESLSAALVIDALRLDPKLTIKTWVVNAGLVNGSDANAAKLFGLGRIHGGPLSTALFRAIQLPQVLFMSPKAEPGIDPRAAQWKTMSVSGPMVLGMFDYMQQLTPPRPGEFAGRVENIILVHAPGDRDSFVHHKATKEWLHGAFDAEFSSFELAQDTSFHCATAEKPGQIGLLLEKLS